MLPFILKALLALLVLVVAFRVFQYVRFQQLPDPAAGLTAPAAEVPQGVRDLAEVLEPIRKRYKLPALAAAVLEGDRLAALGAVGVRRAAQGERVQADDRFHIGSCTKSMTATLCALLVEQGKLRWDTTLAEALPRLADTMHPDYRKVTLEQLLQHRSGLPEDGSPDPELWPKICALTGPLPEQRLAMAALVLASRPAAPPGTVHAYANAGYVLAGAMCEQATGKSWEDLLREHLFTPLGMTTAGFGPPGTAAGVEAPWGHLVNGSTWQALPPGPEADNPLVLGPAGTVHCSLGDWGRYAALHLAGARGRERLLEAATFRKLHTDAHGNESGLGWLVVERSWARGKVLAHDGSNTMWYATIWIAPELNRAYLAASNVGTDKAMAGCHAVIEALIPRK